MTDPVYKRNYEWDPASEYNGFFTQDRPGGVTERVSVATLEARLVADGFAKTGDLPQPSDTPPNALGSASPGASEEYSRRDHVHQMPNAAAVGAEPALGNPVGATSFLRSTVAGIRAWVTLGALAFLDSLSASDVGALPASGGTATKVAKWTSATTLGVMELSEYPTFLFTPKGFEATGAIDGGSFKVAGAQRISNTGKGELTGLNLSNLSANAIPRINSSGDVVDSGISDNGNDVKALSRVLYSKIMRSAWAASDTAVEGSSFAVLETDSGWTKGWMLQLGASNDLAFWNYASSTWTRRGRLLSSGAWHFGTGSGAPTTGTKSQGTMLLLQDAMAYDNNFVDFAIGLNGTNINGDMWFSVPRAENIFSFKWYAKTTVLASLDGTGKFTLNGPMVATGLISSSLTKPDSFHGSWAAGSSTFTDITNWSESLVDEAHYKCFVAGKVDSASATFTEFRFIIGGVSGSAIRIYSKGDFSVTFDVTTIGSSTMVCASLIVYESPVAVNQEFVGVSFVSGSGVRLQIRSDDDSAIVSGYCTRLERIK